MINLKLKPMLLVMLFFALFVPIAAAHSTHNDRKVADAQRVLRDKGIYAGPITGHLDSITRSAVREFQSRNGLKPSGNLNHNTLELLGLERVR